MNTYDKIASDRKRQYESNVRYISHGRTVFYTAFTILLTVLVMACTLAWRVM